MMVLDNSSFFYGKILLFGEYSVLKYSNAVILPYNKVKANLSIYDVTSGNSILVKSNKRINEFYNYLHILHKKGNKDLLMDFMRLKKDIKNGLYLKSTIPENYGMGSSGALCAALLESYWDGEENLRNLTIDKLQSLFALMESFFHGTSSGIDPLCIFLNEAFLLINNDYKRLNADVIIEDNKVKFFLIDTGRTCKTEPLVMYFKNVMNNADYYKYFTGIYIPLVNKACEQWANGTLKENAIFALSRAQQLYLKPMIPDFFQEIWTKGIYTGLYALKLCGSGGGGKLLGFTSDMEGTKNFLWNKYDISIEIIGK